MTTYIVEYKKAFIDSIFVSNKAINTKISGMHGYKPTYLSKQKEESIKYAWLYKG